MQLERGKRGEGMIQVYNAYNTYKIMKIYYDKVTGEVLLIKLIIMYQSLILITIMQI